MKVLVTGGAGFIGSHIVELLIEQGDEVTVVDNLSTGDLSHVHSKARFIKMDILDKNLMETFQQISPDVVIHQAAQVDVHKSILDPMSDGIVNAIGTLHVLEAAKQSSVRKIVYASSCAVYGEPIEEPITESHPVAPISVYGASKSLGESYIRMYHRMCRLDYTILRYANVYGPRQGEKGEGGVISIFLRNLAKGVSSTIFGDGQQTRDFVYVKDVARANVLAAKWGSEQILNVSTAISTSVQSLYELMKEITGVDIAAVYKPARVGDIEHSRLNPERAMLHLGWEPHYTLHQGLTETVEDLRTGKETLS